MTTSGTMTSAPPSIGTSAPVDGHAAWSTALSSR